MSYYYCKKCKRYSTDVAVRCIEDRDCGAETEVCRCVKCGSMDVVEAKECNRCGEPHEGGRWSICPTCREWLRTQAEEFLKRFTDEELDVMFS